MATLQGLTVLVTRPEHQAAPLCALLESAGARVIRLPALQINAVADQHGLPPVSSPAFSIAAASQSAASYGSQAANSDSAPPPGSTDAFDLIVFTSANAVHFGASVARNHAAAALAAIGPATARALAQQGLTVSVTPSGGFDSEHLLSHPRLAEPAGQRILIVTGRQGRDLLRERLTARGAIVTVTAVYERLRPRYSDDYLCDLAAQFAGGGVDIITATSAEVATALLELATPTLRHEFGRVHWLVPGARVADAVRRQGITAPLIQAQSAEDHDLLAAILRWRSASLPD